VQRSETERALLGANQLVSLSRATSLGATLRPLRPVTDGEHLGRTSAPAGDRDLRPSGKIAPSSASTGIGRRRGGSQRNGGL